MMRFLVRLTGLFALAGAVIALVVDGAKSVAASALVLTSLGEAWIAASPGSLAALETNLATHLGQVAADALVGAIMALPVSLFFGALGALLVLAARPAHYRVVV